MRKRTKAGEEEESPASAGGQLGGRLHKINTLAAQAPVQWLGSCHCDQRVVGFPL